MHIEFSCILPSASKIDIASQEDLNLAQVREVTLLLHAFFNQPRR